MKKLTLLSVVIVVSLVLGGCANPFEVAKKVAYPDVEKMAEDLGVPNPLDDFQTGEEENVIQSPQLLDSEEGCFVSTSRPLAPLDTRNTCSILQWTHFAVVSKDTAVWEDLVGWSLEAARLDPDPCEGCDEIYHMGEIMQYQVDEALQGFGEPVCVAYWYFEDSLWINYRGSIVNVDNDDPYTDDDVATFTLAFAQFDPYLLRYAMEDYGEILEPHFPEWQGRWALLDFDSDLIGYQRYFKSPSEEDQEVLEEMHWAPCIGR